jgi:acetolactate synthase-1/2/3 large subunit
MFKGVVLIYGVKHESRRTIGAHGHVITATEDFAPTLEKCLNSKGVHVVVVPVDYSENARVLTHELLATTCLL